MKNIEMIDNKLISLNDRMDVVRILSGNTVKIIAIITMFIDHLSKIVLYELILHEFDMLVPEGSPSYEQLYEPLREMDYFVRFTLYGIGSIAFPLFCFLLAEGFHYTKNKKKYIFLMGAFAIISEIPFDLAFFSDYAIDNGTYPVYFGYQNVFFTLLFGLTALWCLEKFRSQTDIKSKKIISALLQIICVATLAITADLIHVDYGSMGILFIVGFYICRKNRLYQIGMFLILYMLTTGAQPPIYTIISCIVIFLYNGKRGNWNIKYFFYWFYPAHITILYFVMLWLENVMVGNSVITFLIN